MVDADWSHRIGYRTRRLVLSRVARGNAQRLVASLSLLPALCRPGLNVRGILYLDKLAFRDKASGCLALLVNIIEIVRVSHALPDTLSIRVGDEVHVFEGYTLRDVDRVIQLVSNFYSVVKVMGGLSDRTQARVDELLDEVYQH